MKPERRYPQPLETLLLQMIRSSGNAAAHNTRRIFEAWDEASGAARWTLRRYFRDGKLYITLSSSVVRSQLQMRRPELVEAVNLRLSQDPLFLKEDPRVGYVTELILK